MSITATNNPYPEDPDLSPTKLDRGGYEGNAQNLDEKITANLTEVKALIETFKGSKDLGSITPTSVPSTAPGDLGPAFWRATQNGVYTYFGGFTVPANYFAIFSRDVNGVFSVSMTALDLTAYKKITDNIKIETWTAKPYLSGDQVNYLGKDWVSNAPTLSTDVPYSSSKWVVRLTSYENKADLKVGVVAEKTNVNSFKLLSNTINSGYGVDNKGVYKLISSCNAYATNIQGLDFVRMYQDIRTVGNSSVWAFYEDDAFTKISKYEVSPLSATLYKSDFITVPANAKWFVQTKWGAYGDQTPKTYSVVTDYLENTINKISTATKIKDIIKIGLNFDSGINEFVEGTDTNYGTYSIGVKKDEIVTNIFFSDASSSFAYFLKTDLGVITNITSSVTSGVYTATDSGLFYVVVYKVGLLSSYITMIANKEIYTSGSYVKKGAYDTQVSNFETRITNTETLTQGVPIVLDSGVYYNINDGFEGYTLPATAQKSLKFICEPNKIYILSGALPAYSWQFSNSTTLIGNYIAFTKIKNVTRFITAPNATCFVLDFKDSDNPSGYASFKIQSSPNTRVLRDQLFLTVNAIGDSVTQGAGATSGLTYPYYLGELLTAPIYKVNTYGIGGADANSILSMAGGMPLYLTSEVTIPSTTTTIDIALNVGVKDPANTAIGNPYTIADIEGTMTYVSPNYKFTRSVAGVQKAVPVNTRVISNASKNCLRGVNIIYVGINDNVPTGNDSAAQTLVNKIKLMADKSRKYLVLSHHTINDAVVKTKMRDTFSQYHIDLYLYFNNTISGVNNAKIDAVSFGLITQAQADANTWQQLFLADSIHLNSNGYYLLAKLIHRNMVSLDFLIE